MSRPSASSSVKLKTGTDDVVHSSVFKLAWPIFVQALLSMLLGYADTLMLSDAGVFATPEARRAFAGCIDQNAVAAASSASGVMSLA